MITSLVEPTKIDPILVQRPIGLASITAAVAAFALVMLCVGGLGPAEARRVQMLTSITTFGLLVWLVMLVANRNNLSAHMGYLMMLFGAIYWFVSPAFFLSLQADAPVGSRYGMMLRPQAITTACLYISTYILASVATYWISYALAIRWSERSSGFRVPDKIYLIILALFVAGFIPYLLFGGGLETIIQALMAGRTSRAPWKSGSLGDERSALYYLSRSGMVAAAGFAGTWALLAAEARYRIILLGIFCFTSLLVFFDGGTRSWVALAALPTLLTWMAFVVRDRLTLGRLFMFLLIVASTQLAFEFARAGRTHGWNSEQAKSIDPLERRFDNDFFTDLAVSIDLVPKRQGFFHLGDLWAFVSHPIPRFLWSDKPVSPILVYYNDVVFKGLLSNKGNKLPSHIGQFHMSFGALAVVMLGILSGVISAMASAMMRSRFVGWAHVGAVLATWWFIMARGVYPGWTYVLIFAWIVCVFGFRTMRSPQTA